MRPPAPTDPDDSAALLAWAARLHECGEHASRLALLLRARADQPGLIGPAGDALASLAEVVAAQVAAVSARADDAAAALVRAAHDATRPR